MDQLDQLLARIEPADRTWEETGMGEIALANPPARVPWPAGNHCRTTGGNAQKLELRSFTKLIFTMAGDHGVAAEGVSAYPQEVTPQMVYSFVQGWASINVLARHVGADVRVVDCGVAAISRGVADHPPKNSERDILIHPRSGHESRRGHLRSASWSGTGREGVHREGYQLVGTGDMGIANTTPSTAIVAVLSGKPVAELAGRGTGIDDVTLERKIAVIEKGLAVNQPDTDDPLDVLSKVGGFEIAALAGALLGAAAAKSPLICDGFIATAGALIACQLAPAAKDYLFLSHRSQELGHPTMVELLGLEPILDLQMRLGEGTGSVLAMTIVEAAAKVLMEIKTFEEAGVTDTGH